MNWIDETKKKEEEFQRKQERREVVRKEWIRRFDRSGISAKTKRVVKKIRHQLSKYISFQEFICLTERQFCIKRNYVGQCQVVVYPRHDTGDYVYFKLFASGDGIFYSTGSKPRQINIDEVTEEKIEEWIAEIYAAA